MRMTMMKERKEQKGGSEGQPHTTTQLQSTIIQMGGNAYKGTPKTAVSSEPVDGGDADVGEGDGYDIDADVFLGGDLRGSWRHNFSSYCHTNLTRFIHSAHRSTKPNGNGINLREYLLDERPVLRAQCCEEEALAVRKACSVREWCNVSGREFAQRLATESRGHPQVVRLQAKNESGTQRLPRVVLGSRHGPVAHGDTQDLVNSPRKAHGQVEIIDPRQERCLRAV